MKKIITSIILLCAVIITFAILKNISFNEGIQSKKTAELSKEVFTSVAVTVLRM